MNTEKISPRQFSVLVSFYTIGSAILIIPSSITAVAKNDAWISCLLVTTGGVAIVLLYSKVGSLYPNMTFVELSEKVLGKFLGKIVSVLFFLFCFLLSSIILYNIGDFLILQIMPETPILAIYIIFLFVILYAVRLGIETITRATEVFFPWTLGLLVIFLALLFPSYEFKNIVPVFENGFIPILKGSYTMLAFPLFEFVALLMVVPSVSNKEKLTKSLVIGWLIGSSIITLVTSICILVLGADFTMRNFFPIYILGKKIAIGHFLERIEIIVAIIWILTTFFKLSITVYACIKAFSQIFNLKDYRPITYPMGIYIIIGTLVFIPDSVFLIDFSKDTFNSVKLLIGFVLPLFIYFVAKIKKAKSRQL